MKSVVEQGFFHEFAFDNKALKTFVEFRICYKRPKNVVEFEFELRHIPTLGDIREIYKVKSCYRRKTLRELHKQTRNINDNQTSIDS